jgi:predicted RecA/RadA family phage recombinase
LKGIIKMKNFIQPGDVLTLIAPHDVLPGEGLQVGALFGVATGKALLGAEVEAVLEGVFNLKKDNTVPTQGAKAYWDSTAKKVTVTVATNIHIGYFAKTALAGDTEVNVKLLF